MTAPLDAIRQNVIEAQNLEMGWSDAQASALEMSRGLDAVAAELRQLGFGEKAAELQRLNIEMLRSTELAQGQRLAAEAMSDINNMFTDQYVILRKLQNSWSDFTAETQENLIKFDDWLEVLSRFPFVTKTMLDRIRQLRQDYIDLRKTVHVETEFKSATEAITSMIQQESSA